MTAAAVSLPDNFWPFMLAALLIELTPGPNMAWLAMVAATEGRLRGYAAVLGVAVGLAVIGLAASVGVAELIRASPLLYDLLRWAGVLFLLYLAYDGWRSGRQAGDDGAGGGLRRAFLRGLTTNLLNPKAAIFYVAVLPTFVAPGQSPATQTMILTAAYVAVATLVHLAIVTLCGTFRRFVADARREQAARRFLSLALAGVAMWFAWSTAR